MQQRVMKGPDLRSLLLGLAVGIVLCGCGQRRDEQRPGTGLAEQPFVYQDLDPRELVATLEKRYEILKNFSAQPVRATISNKLAPFGQENLSGSLVLEKPNKLRLSLAKVHSPFRFDAICDGNQFWLIHHHQKAIYTGLLNEPINSRGERVALNPVDMFNAIFAPELTKDAGFKYRIIYVEVPTPELYLIVVLNSDYPNKLYSKVWVDRSTLHITRHQLYKPDIGEVKLDAFFSDFAERTRYEIPHKIVLQWPEMQTALALDLKGLKVNQEFRNPNLFKYEYTDKEYGEVRITGTEMPDATGRLQEKDARGRPVAAPTAPPAIRTAPAPPRSTRPTNSRPAGTRQR